MAKPIGEHTIYLESLPRFRAEAAIAGKKEGEGPLGSRFDCLAVDSYLGETSWEKGEQTMLRSCYELALKKAGLDRPNFILAGDLTNQCTATALGLKDSGVPYLGLYGACSTMGEALALGAMLIDGGSAENICAAACSHFCTAERQFRTPLEYGAQRCPSTQWTVTGCGAAILSRAGSGPAISYVTPGKIVDAGISDPCDMGSAMAPAAADSIIQHLKDTGRKGTYYDAVITGDLGHLGHKILAELLRREVLDMPMVFTDCGMLMYNEKTQDTHSGGSGCGCCASVLCGHIVKCLREGIWKSVLFAPTGALMSPTSSMQGQSIPGICHTIAIEVLP